MMKATIRFLSFSMTLLIAFGAGRAAATAESTQSQVAVPQESVEQSQHTRPIWHPKKIASFDKDQLAAMLGADPFGAQVLTLAGTPACGVDYHYFFYFTTGARTEPTTATGAIMTPTGGPGCTGPRPILVYTHGTAVTKSYNLAKVTDPTNEAWQEAAMIAAFYAAHGYIVVAPNYAGYDRSSLNYHPYLNAKQQSNDVIHALWTARAFLHSGIQTQARDNGQLFITGYSQGGYVAMATHRAMEARGMRVTASAPMSGPYAMLAFGDATAMYSPGLGGTIYYPMIINSYQRAYGDIYQSLNDIYTPTYSSGIDHLIPGKYTFETLITSGKLPQLALYNSVTPGQGSEPGTGSDALDALLAAPDPAVNPIGALAFGNPSLFTNSFRIRYALDSVATPDGAVPFATNLLPPSQDPTMPLRRALKKNDLRGWTPKAPLMLCGGMNDPEVFYSVNTWTMKQLWSAKLTTGQVKVIDVDPSTNGNEANAGQIATLVSTIAGYVAANEPGAAASQIGNDIRSAIARNASFSSYFNSQGVPNSPQGVMALAIASVAGQAATTTIQQGVTSPSDIASQVGRAVIAAYHYPSAQMACETAAKAYFEKF